MKKNLKKDIYIDRYRYRQIDKKDIYTKRNIYKKESKKDIDIQIDRQIDRDRYRQI